MINKINTINIYPVVERYLSCGSLCFDTVIHTENKHYRENYMTIQMFLVKTFKFFTNNNLL